MPRGKKANAEASLEALEVQLKTQYDLNVKVIDELKGKSAESDGEDVKEAIKLLRTPGLDLTGDILPYLKMRIKVLKEKGRIGTKKSKPTAAPKMEG